MSRIILILFILLWGVFPAQAAQKNVTLYPDSADVLEVADFAQKANILEIPLPQAMQDNTLRVTVNGAKVLELAVLPALLPEPPRMAALLGKLNTAEKEAATLQGQIRDLQARLALWREPNTYGLKVEGMREMEQAMAERSPVLDAEIRTLNDKLHVVQASILWLQEELARMSGTPGKPAQAKLTGTKNAVPGKIARIRLEATTPGTPLPETCTVSLAYQMRDCGWTSRYILEALPEQQLVRVSREATIIQQTGMDWENVTLSLSTARPSAAPVSEYPPSWNIGPMHAAAAPMARNMVAMEKSAPSAQDFMGAAFATPMRSEEATGALWALGQRLVNSGDPVRLSLDSQDWKAEFYRLLRPSVRKTAWLMASATAPTPQQFEAAEAAVYVNSQYMGLTRFTFGGTTGTIAFGDDPAVSVIREQDVNRSGETGFIAKAQTRKWIWTITAKNAHTFPVEVRVEDAAPQAEDERIKITTESNPKPVIKGRTLHWPLTLQPGAQTVIRHAVSFTAPEDMSVNPGR